MVNNGTVYKPDMTLRLKSLTLVILGISFAAIIINQTTQKPTLIITIVITLGLFLYLVFEKRLTMLEIDEDNKILRLKINQFLFIEVKSVFEINKTYVFYGKAVGARGVKHETLKIYDEKKRLITSVIPFSSGWRRKDLQSIQIKMMELGAKNISNNI